MPSPRSPEAMKMKTNTGIACEASLFGKHEQVSYFNRCYAVIHMTLFLCFLLYRFMDGIHGSFGPWAVALACEALFAFYWITEYNLRWSSVTYQTYLDRFEHSYGGENADKLPAVDVFITTADTKMESPLVSMNTVLSVLALDYPTHKLACYISDDGASPIVYHSLLEAFKFAKIWAPFCKKYKLETRAPVVFFDRQEYMDSHDKNFITESQLVKEEYEAYKARIFKAIQTREVPSLCLNEAGFAFKLSDITNHSSIVKVIHEHKEEDDSDFVSHIIYVAREKRPNIKHHYKAGAMNVMTRVSGLMTNAPYILNLDCDMFINNSKVIKQAMCFFMSFKSERYCGFVQFPQLFYAKNEDNPGRKQLDASMKLLLGSNGMQGPHYFGTNCFHRRKALYNCPPEYKNFTCSWSHENFAETFGKSSLLVASAKAFLRGERAIHMNSSSPSSMIGEALELSKCEYEINTSWGKEVQSRSFGFLLKFKDHFQFNPTTRLSRAIQVNFNKISIPLTTQVGWKYGSLLEDTLTGCRIHSIGWHSLLCFPSLPGFLGCALSDARDLSTQQRRWACGLTDILFNALTPFLGWRRKMSIRQRLLYVYLVLWGIMAVATTCYMILPIYSIFSGKPSLPQSDTPTFLLAILLVLLCKSIIIKEYLCWEMSLKEWWAHERALTIYNFTSRLFGTLDIIVKIIGFKDTKFEITPKRFEDEAQDVKQAESGVFTPAYLHIPPTTILLLSIVAVAFKTYHVVIAHGNLQNKMITEYFLCVWSIVCLLPYLKALLRKNSHLPLSTIASSTILTLLLFIAWLQ